MKRQVLIILTALLLVPTVGTAFAANNPGATGSDSNIYNAMDSNGDNQISENEFNIYFESSGLFDRWDANDDGSIDDVELGDALYDYYDDDDNGYIDDAEWKNGIMVDDYGDEGLWDK